MVREGASAEALAEAHAELAECCRLLAEEYEFIARSNQPDEFMEPAKVERVRQIAAKTYELDGKTLPYLTPDEVHNLSVTRGTLTEEQMQIMREHVVVTRRMLAEVPFKRHLVHVPEYASQHHEKINGKGYPDGLRAEQLSLPSRILAVADVYEALSAKDRPYKKPMPEEKVLSILTQAAERGEIDPEIVRLLVEDGVHRTFEEEYAPDRSLSPEGSSRLTGGCHAMSGSALGYRSKTLRRISSSSRIRSSVMSSPPAPPPWAATVPLVMEQTVGCRFLLFFPLDCPPNGPYRHASGHLVRGRE